MTKPILSDEQQHMLAHADSAPPVAAYRAAVHVAATLAGKGRKPALWPFAGEPGAAGSRNKKADAKAAIVKAVGTLADFVRSNPDAPAEALYRHARNEGLHGQEAGGYEALPLWNRMAFETFRSTLYALDASMIEEKRKLPQDHPAPAPVPIEDTIFEPQDGIFDTVSYARPAKAAPAKKAPPATKAAAKRR